MIKLLLAFLVCVTLQGVTADTCHYQLYPYNTHRTAYCDYGCCYTTIYPCCSAPFYVGATFIAPVAIGSVAFVIIIIVVAVIRVRRRRITTTIQYGAPAQPQIVTTQTATNTYGGYNNQAYPPPPGYAVQPGRY